MPVSTRSKSSTALKPVSKSEWNAVEALLFIKKTPAVASKQQQQQQQQQQQGRPHRASATYTPGTFAGMEE